LNSESRSKLSWPWIASLSLVAVVGFGMRLFRLSYWGLAHDELFTLRDSLRGGELALRPKALLFILNHYLVAPFFELDEFGLRILPMVFGVAGIIAVFFLVYRLFGPLSGFFAALLVTFNPWHLYWSQNARYQSLVFLLSAVVPVALYIGVKEQRPRWMALAGLSAVLAVLAHPSAAFVVAGCMVWLAGAVGLRILRGRSTSRPLLAVTLAILILFAVATAFQLGPTLLTRAKFDVAWGIRGPFLVASFGNWLTAGVTIFGAGGFLWMWRDEPRELSVLLALAIGVPMLALALLGYVLPVSVGYLFCAAPFILIAAGYFLARLTSLGTDSIGRTLLGSTCALAVVAGGLIPVASHYINGGRPDFKGVGRHIEARALPGDLVLGDRTLSLRYYLKAWPVTTPSAYPVQTFHRDPAELDSILGQVTQSGGRLWIVAYIAKRAGFEEQGLGAASPWVWENCVLDTVIGRQRLDYKVDDLNVYLCDGGDHLAASARE